MKDPVIFVATLYAIPVLLLLMNWKRRWSILRLTWRFMVGLVAPCCVGFSIQRGAFSGEVGLVGGALFVLVWGLWGSLIYAAEQRRIHRALRWFFKGPPEPRGANTP